MNKSISVSLTVYFECPFWIGVFERTCGQTLQAHRIIFGSTEPKDYFVYDIILHRYQNIPYGKAIDSQIKHQKKKMNPKRMQRQINRMLTSSSGVSTKAQEAMRISRESQKQERVKLNKQKKTETKKAQFSLRQSKKKEKKKGH